MRIFITGATGVIGRRVVPQLLAQRHEVTVATRARGGPPVPWPGKIRNVPVDLLDPATLPSAVQGHEAVINLATAMPSSSFKMMFRYAWRMNDRLRRDGSRNLVDAAMDG